jgi:SOS regulatory protein LexA
MELDNMQKKIIRSKPFGLSIVKGDTGSGKTTTAIYRMLHLKNNFCLYDDDGILMVNCGNNTIEDVVTKYKVIEETSNFEYLSLFSSSKENVYIKNLDSIVYKYFNRCIADNNMKVQVLKDSSLKEEIIEQCILELKDNYKKSKLLNLNYKRFFIEEIMWIKACNYLQLEEYQKAIRIGRKYPKGEGPQRLLKESKDRELIFECMRSYDKKLREQGYVDEEDAVLLALQKAKQNPSHRYTHLIIDESENLTRTQIELLRCLSHNKIYSSFMFLLNQNKELQKNAWLSKGRKQNSLGFGIGSKSYPLKKIYSVVETSYDIVKEEKIVAEEPVIKEDKLIYEEQSIKGEQLVETEKQVFKSFIDKYNYIDMRHHTVFEFSIDSSKSSDFILKQGEKETVLLEEELKDIPVYSDIAAGEPILMNSEIEANFNLPQYWLKGLKDCFMLKVKGDSMIGANIESGDYVVIKKQSTANNRDIVAVDIDGASTLKRLSLGKGGPTLIPENPKYSTIPLYGKDAKILGVAVGVVKSI